MAKQKKDQADKAEKKPNPKVVEGTNILTEDQKAALFHNHLAKYQQHLGLKKKADADFKNVCKMIKAEGTTLVDINTAIKLSGEEGEAVVKAEIADTIRVARWMGHSVGYQMEMFPDRRPATDRAYDDGKVAGLAGQVKKPPFDANLPQCARWSDGWHDGQAALTMKMAPKAPKPPEQPQAKPPEATPKPPAPPAH